MEATYFNFTSVIATVDQQVMNNLSQSTSLDQFKQLSIVKKEKEESKKKEKKKLGFMFRKDNKASPARAVTSKKQDQTWMRTSLY
jgi:hypothetical protein